MNDHQIKCGKCHGTHTSSTEVRECYRGQAPSKRVGQQAPAPSGSYTREDLSASSWKVAQQVKDNAVPAKRVDFSKIPASNYALAREDGTLEFFKVTTGKAGSKWDGFRFVEKLIGAPGDWRVLKMRGAQAAAVLSKIATDEFKDTEGGIARTLRGAEAAAVRYSRKHKCCAACNSPLSDPESVQRGLGPVCAKRY